MAPGRAVRLHELAAGLRFSPRRLTRAVNRLEREGWVRRRPCTDDRRVQWAELTAAGQRKLKATAPGHVAEVRARVFDPLDAEQLQQLRGICETLLAARG